MNGMRVNSAQTHFPFLLPAKLLLGILAICPIFEASQHSRGYATEIFLFQDEESFFADPPASLRKDLNSTLAYLRVDDVCLGGYEGMSSQSAYCAYNAGHTACLYNKIDGTACGTVYARKVTAAEQTEILDAHNAKRRRVAKGDETIGSQPGAQNMRKLTWDSEAASIAQLMVDQCKYEHDRVRNTIKGSVIYNGQNLFASWGSSLSTTSSWTAAVDAWYSEVKDWSSANINPYKFASATGHYTQVVWATTERVGCGAIVYQAPGSSSYTKLYACNYAPAGNWEGSAMYIQGTACNQCPATTTCVMDSLCG
ncbi:unnamed protein product [Notodromas monacha]|uniref:SCP domain-containing protein n=1 Tax=Notodromas monacha TaxID=399045 RepID=A0A7R9BDH2_9CRUS|nr:unnamed protein product [Notodromas monacha]CAG0913318.1 unnamed protein product [Notodromas monacha]